MKTFHLFLSLSLILFASLQGHAQSEATKKELQEADAKYLYGKKYEEAKKIYLKHAQYLSPQQQTYLGICYYADPSKSSQSYAEGMKWLIKASDRGNTEAMLSIAEIYQVGLGVKKDSVQQVSWMKKAADYGDRFALVTTGYYYETGWGLPKDKSKAKELYLKAIDKGSREGSYYLAMLEEDNGNVTNMMHYLEKSAKSGYAPAQYELGEIYAAGLNGVKVDIDEAIRWYKTIENRPETREYYNYANSIIHNYGQREPSTDLQKVKPLLEQLVSRANEGFYDLRGKIITPRDDKSMYDNIGSNKNEYYASLIDLGFKNAYIRKNNFSQLQKNNSVKQVDFYSYRADIVHSTSAAASYKVYTQWVNLIKTIFPDWKTGDESNLPDRNMGKIAFWKDYPGGRRTVIELKTCCPNGEVQIEIESKQFPQ